MMELSPKLAYSITRSLEDHGIETTRDTYSVVFDNLEGDDLVEAAGFLNYHGFSRRVISEILGTPYHTTVRIIESSGTTAPDNVIGLDGRAQRNTYRPGRPVAARDDLLVRDLEKVVDRLSVFAASKTDLSPRAADLVREVSRLAVS